MKAHRSRIAGSILTAVTVMGFAVCNLGHGAPAGTAVEAIWYDQSLDFQYLSTSVAYSCPAMKLKLAAILRSVGVAESLAMRCSEDGLSRSFNLRLQTKSAIEATAANLAAVTTYDARRRLLAHLQGEQLPSAVEVPRFNARWQRVELHRQRQLRLEPGDCELLQQVSRQLFPKLAITVERNGFDCHSGSPTRIGNRLSVVALMPDQQRETSVSLAPQAEQT